MISNTKAPHRKPQIKFMKGALATSRIEAADTGGISTSGIANWRQVDLVNTTDTGLVLVSGLAQHIGGDSYNSYFWYHQCALIVDGEMITQDLDTGGVYKAHPGDLYYWAPGHRHRTKGDFRAFFVKTPVPMRWVRGEDGTKRGVEVLEMDNEILYPSSPPDETRKDIVEQSEDASLQPKMKFIRDAVNASTVEVKDSGDLDIEGIRRIDVVDPIDTNLALSIAIVEQPSGRAFRHHFRHHEIALLLTGEMIAYDLDTGGVYKAQEGDLFYWAPGLRLKTEGQCRIYSVRVPPPVRWIKTDQGMMAMDMFHLKGEYSYPASPPDEVRKEPIE